MAAGSGGGGRALARLRSRRRAARGRGGGGVRRGRGRATRARAEGLDLREPAKKRERRQGRYTRSVIKIRVVIKLTRFFLD